MFVLISKLKNEVIKTEDGRKRDRLLDLGYTLVEEPEKKPNLDNMTVTELEEFAASKNISLEGCANKAEKLSRIKEAMCE